MQAFTIHRGLAVPLAHANLDTDVIVRMARCAAVPRAQLGRWAFEALRFRPDGQPEPGCVFNDARFAGASILLADENFGCGSSREMAVWALAGMGLRCVVAPSFGDIFFANCFQNGLLPLCLPAPVVAALRAQAAGGGLQLEVDLPAQRLRGAATGPLAFEVDPLRKTLLVSGTDEIGLALAHAGELARWQARDRAARPWVYAPLRIPAPASASTPPTPSPPRRTP
jgi:3-isopropylmalate/(R)-2-methylmalate dehydratase small subunit